MKDEFRLAFKDRASNNDNVVAEPFKTKLELMCFINDIKCTKDFLVKYERTHTNVTNKQVHSEYYIKMDHLYVEIKKRAENSLTYNERKAIPKRGAYMYNLIKTVIDKWANINK